MIVWRHQLSLRSVNDSNVDFNILKSLNHKLIFLIYHACKHFKIIEYMYIYIYILFLGKKGL